MKEKLNPLDFLYDDKNDVENSRPFNYYIYHGSMTAPPCAENVIWIIPEETMEISSTVIGMFMDSLIDPEDDSPNPTTSGNNR